MTKKDYILIADQLKEAYNLTEYMQGSVQVKPSDAIKALIKDLAVRLKIENPRFNTNKWNSYIFGSVLNSI